MRARDPMKFTMTEAEMCSAFISEAVVGDRRRKPEWIAYPETAGFDILLVRQSDGVQIGIEAKLSFNTKVICQAIPYDNSAWGALCGPDYRAILIPAHKTNGELSQICAALGITVIQYRGCKGGYYYGPHSYGPIISPDLPSEESIREYTIRHWFEWCPLERCKVPDYVPDVQAGASAPVALTDWKIRAIKLSIILKTRPISRADLKALGLSPTFWVGPRGWLVRTPDGWVAGDRTPDFARQHPRNYAEIEADRPNWDITPAKKGTLL